MSDDLAAAGCTELLAAAGLAGEFRLEPITEGANNRALRVVRDGEPLLLKAYFQHPDDPRDRLGTEYAFCEFAWSHGVDTVPRPLAADRARGLGLYEFVEGNRLARGEVDDAAVGQALAFFRALNRHKHTVAARRLADGSEACYSVDAHLRCVASRVDRLAAIAPGTSLDGEALDFVRDQLGPAWTRVSNQVERQVGAGSDAPLDTQDRCLSPSDFGFHNALREPGGRIRFLDFEYAGWDDPTKLVCDFFCQPAVPVPQEHFEWFAAGVVADARDGAGLLRRIRCMLPVYRIKWCCILLNDFLPVGRARRRFATSTVDDDARKAGQLRKARLALENLEQMSMA